MAAPVPGCAQAAQKAGPDGSAVTAVRALEMQWVEALNAGDSRTIGAILADDFVRAAPQSGTFIRRDQLLSWYAAHGQELRSRHRRIEGMTIRVYGPTSVVRGELILTDSSGHSTQKLLFTDVFVERAGRWQAVSAQENPISDSGSH